MTRNLKTLGLALVAVFALCAVAASAASAAEDSFTAESYPAMLTGRHDPSVLTPDTLGMTSGSVKCPNPSFAGTISGPSSQVTVTPAFNSAEDNCTAFGLPAVIDTNGCDFLFTLDVITTTGTADLLCPLLGDITITAGQNTAGTLTTKCTVHIPPQTGINGVSFSNVGSGTTREIKVTINASNLKYTHTSGTGLGACSGGGATEQSNGTFVAAEIFTAENEFSGAHIGSFLSRP